MSIPVPNLSPAELEALCSEYIGRTPLIIAWVLGSTATLAVCLRLYVRIFLRKTMGWDDYTIVVALIIGILDNAFFTKMYDAGIGRHVLCISPQRTADVVKWSTIAQIVEVICIAFVKISVCLFILRVIEGTSRRITQLLWMLIIFIILCHLAPLLLYVLQCRPLNKVWEPMVPGNCYSSRLTYTAAYVAIGLDAFTDLACATIPIFVIQKLQMDLRTKIAVCILMGLGVLTAACAIAKAVYLDGVFSADYPWAITVPAIWSVAETQLSLNIASIPTLPPLFATNSIFSFGSFLSSRGKKSSRGSSNLARSRSREGLSPTSRYLYKVGSEAYRLESNDGQNVMSFKEERDVKEGDVTEERLGSPKVASARFKRELNSDMEEVEMGEVGSGGAGRDGSYDLDEGEERLVREEARDLPGGGRADGTF
ncbi:hypothetical protein MMC25_005555 [Agyrium rufum]|nr:hypothetical protein [Agyrium rufum]